MVIDSYSNTMWFITMDVTNHRCGHPLVITIDSWDVNHSQSWVVHDIVIPTLDVYGKIM